MTEQARAPTAETRRIEDIIIGDRFRKDLGDIDSLANKIDDVGLLEPIGITPDNILICGARRIAAYKRLGRTEIPVIIIALEDIIKGQLIENTARKDFTFSERQAILQEIERQRIGHRVSKESSANLQTFQKDNKGKPSVNIVADYTGLSPRQLSKEKDVYIHAKSNSEELGYLMKQLDDGDITVNEACNVIARHKQEQIERKEERAKQAIIKKREELKKQKPDLTNTAIRNMFHGKRSRITDETLDEAGIGPFGKDILLRQVDRILSRPDKEKIKPAAADVHASTTTTTTSSAAPKEHSISIVANLGDYDPTKRDSYDRQTLYKVIDWLLEQNRMLREANRNLRANNKRAANDNSTTSKKGGADV